LIFEEEYKKGKVFLVPNQRITDNPYEETWQIYYFFFSLSDMVTALKHDTTPKQLFERYLYTSKKGYNQSLESFLKHGLIKR